jgi:hypothetical protein
MKKYCFILLAQALSLSAMAHSESQQTAPTASVTISSPKEKFELPNPPYKIRSAEFNVVKGQYDLSNGVTLTMQTTGRRMYAYLDGISKMEILAAAPNIFVAKNKQMKMTFEQAPNGNVSGVLVKYMAPVESKGVKRTPKNN